MCHRFSFTLIFLVSVLLTGIERGHFPFLVFSL